MKKLAALTIALTMSTAYAAEHFAGIEFHSSVPKEQIDALKVDLTYLYRTPTTKTYPTFSSMSGLTAVNGASMHNWLLNRVKYIVGETYELTDENIVTKRFHSFPKTPLPPGFESAAGSEEVTTVMSNIGAAVYIIGKKENMLFGLKLDNSNVYAKSPRAGILQVGRGLFLEKFAINKELLSNANSISRLGTLFHEARHSDGSGTHTGFVHATCPEGHGYAGYAACEKANNGPYSLGAASEIQMLENCTTCSTKDKSVLSVRAADSMARVVDADLATQIHRLKKAIATADELIKAYEDLATKYPDKVHLIEAEMNKVKNKRTEFQARLTILEKVKPSISPLDPKPEGDYKEISLKDSVKTMERSLKK